MNELKGWNPVKHRENSKRLSLVTHFLHSKHYVWHAEIGCYMYQPLKVQKIITNLLQK